MSTTYNLGGGDFTQMNCGECGCTFFVPHALYRDAKEKGPRRTWYCPNGHPRIFSESDSDKMRRERDRAVQQNAYLQDALTSSDAAKKLAERRVSAAKGQITKLKKRAANGICPCCNRSFANLQRHMANQHPGFIAEPDATEHVH